ncbi:hypothetical protein TK45_00445 [Bowmanella sp. JS7-9]|nr:hypothetical protein TK45_00445 [Bowmanella sp. JS7-9]
MAGRLRHLSPKVIDAETTGLPFPLLRHLRGEAADIKVKSLSNDLQASSLVMGVHQIEALNQVLEVAMASGIDDNLALKQFLTDHLDSKLRNHIADFLLLLRSNKQVEQNQPGLYIHDLSAFDELRISRALYAMCILRYSKNSQFKDASQAVMLVFDEAELLLEGRSN